MDLILLIEATHKMKLEKMAAILLEAFAIVLFKGPNDKQSSSAKAVSWYTACNLLFEPMIS